MDLDNGIHRISVVFWWLSYIVAMKFSGLLLLDFYKIRIQ